MNSQSGSELLQTGLLLFQLALDFVLLDKMLSLFQWQNFEVLVIDVDAPSFVAYLIS
jgi:hypothetical protein